MTPRRYGRLAYVPIHIAANPDIERARLHLNSRWRHAAPK
jgi:hypothetical protein